MPLKSPRNHNLIWSDLLKDLNISSSWPQIIRFLYNKEHGYSNYKNCEKRNHDQVRSGVYEDKRIRNYLAADDKNLDKIEKVLDEMCHLLTSQHNPTAKLKYAGSFFVKCITKIYSSIYVNNHILPLRNGFKLENNLLREQYLSLSSELPIVILPTHRSYMDFLFISYIMTHYELPLPIVATGDNFKAMGTLCTNYLKSTGAFLVRRNATQKNDVEATMYYDILRAYVHSIIKGGENPLEFFMEGTRTRVGQVLRPKTGLLSMVVDTFIDQIVDDIYIMPVAINYQRPIEEQLYVGENTPQIDLKKPKESAKNLFNAFNAIMKRRYGKVYVRFLEPFKLSEYFNEWKKVTGYSVDNADRDAIIHDFTNSLASEVCLAQAKNNILMPFNLLACSILSRSFLERSCSAISSNGKSDDCRNGAANSDIARIVRIPISELIQDFYLVEQLLQTTQSQFVPGWEKHFEILDEFNLDRDGIVRYTPERRYIEFNYDALTFQTLLYYSNQVVQILLPVAICFVLNNSEPIGKWEQYKSIRTLLLKDFFSNETFMRQEFDGALAATSDIAISNETKSIIVKHLYYFTKSYSTFLVYLRDHEIFNKSEFFQHKPSAGRPEDLYISKDMLKNMTNLVIELGICESIPSSDSLINGRTNSRKRIEEDLKLINGIKLDDLINEYQRVLNLAINVIKS